MPTKVQRAVIYARISQEREQSVSIDQQIDDATAEATRRGWEVVAVHADRSVSATKKRPAERSGWRRALATPADVVMVWRLDRVTRRLADYADAVRDMQAAGLGFVSVKDGVDLTTREGRLLAGILASFAEFEAETIALRVGENRRALIQQGRRAGGRVPFGYRNVPNPHGPGLVLAHDPETIGTLREMVTRALDGESLWALARWLDEVSPARRAKFWSPESVEAILTNPVLAGMTPYTPGRKSVEPKGRETPLDVLRNAEGEPVIDAALAIISTDTRDELLAELASRKMPGTRRPRADIEPALLSGVIRCGACKVPLHRATANGYAYYRCQNRDCSAPVQVNRAKADEWVSTVFVWEHGDHPTYRWEASAAGAEAAELAGVIAARWAAIPGMSGSARADAIREVERLEARLASLPQSAPAAPVAVPTGQTMREQWEAAESVGERNAILRDSMVRVFVGPGRGFSTARMEADMPLADGEYDGELEHDFPVLTIGR